MDHRLARFAVAVFVLGSSLALPACGTEPSGRRRRDAAMESPDGGTPRIDEDADVDASAPPMMRTGGWYEDGDGDGVADEVERAAGTDPADALDNPRTRGDFFFVVPYERDPEPLRDTLVLGTTLQRADVHFMIDTSISMQGYIDTVRTSLTTTVVPGIRAAIADVAFGVGEFDVCPSSGYSPGTCNGIQVAQTSTLDSLAIEGALAALSADCMPVHEPYAQAAWLWATGDISRLPGAHAGACPAGAVGLGCVREGALPILVVIGDERYSESHNLSGGACGGGGCASFASSPAAMDIVDAFTAIHGRLVVLGPTGTSPEWAPLVTATGAVDATGAPLIFGLDTDLEDEGLVDAWTILGPTVGARRHARYLSANDQAKSILGEVKLTAMVGSFVGSVPQLVAVIRRARAQRDRLVWDRVIDHELDRLLSIRERYGIRLLDRPPAT